MSQTIQLRGDTTANWTAANPVLAVRELGFNLDTFAYKIGDGVTAWNSLLYRELTGVFGAALLMEAIANPAVPGAGSMHFYAHDVAGRIIPKWQGPSGLDNPVQSAVYANGMILLTPASGAALSVIGQAAPTAVGTIAHPAIVAGVNLRSSIRRATITSAATANAASELRFAFALSYRGEAFGAVPTGGFFMPTRFAVSSTTALQRCAVGLFTTTAAIATTQSPSALTNCIFAGWDSADTNLQIMHNDGAGSCTKINLGAAFPANNPAAIYEVIFFCAPNGDAVGYRVKRLDTDDTATGIITTDLPTKTTLLTWHAYANNGGTAAAVVLEFMRMYLETDF
jgi:hypothetical protein